MTEEAPLTQRSARRTNTRRSKNPAPPIEQLALDFAAPPTPSRSSAVLKWAKTLAGIALALGLAAACVSGLRRYITTSERFGIREVSVTGATRRSEDEVRRMTGLTKGRNVFTVDLDKVAQKLLADPWFREAHVARRLPDAIQIELKEREPYGLVATPDLSLAERDGHLIKPLELGDPSDFPIITGLNPTDFADDKEGFAIAVKNAFDAAAEYNDTRLAERFPLSEIHVQKGGSLEIVTQSSGLTFVLGPPPLHKKLDRAHRVIAELDRRGAKAAAILLDSETRPDRVVVRLR